MTPQEAQNFLLHQGKTVERPVEQKQPVSKPPILTEFTSYTRRYALFNLFFLSVITLQILLIFFLFSTWVESALLATNLGLVFATSFIYFILKMHFQARKPEKFEELCNRFIEEFGKTAETEAEGPEWHALLAGTYTKMAQTLQGWESRYYTPIPLFRTLAPTLRKFSRYCHWMDVHKMKEALLLRSVKEYVNLVKREPTDLELHAALANAYVMLSGLYHLPSKQGDDGVFFQGKDFQNSMKEKFTKASRRAIEEFKILNEYAPNDPWVHQQLAYSYHDLQMPEEEIKEYEFLFELVPFDDDVLFKLGTLYFEQGENAKGLAIYEKLLEINPPKAAAMIEHYGL